MDITQPENQKKVTLRRDIVYGIFGILLFWVGFFVELFYWQFYVNCGWDNHPYCSFVENIMLVGIIFIFIGLFLIGYSVRKSRKLFSLLMIMIGLIILSPVIALGFKLLLRNL